MNAQVIGRVKLERVNDRSRSNTMVLARYYAKQAVKEQWQRLGVKPHHIVASELSRQADAYLDQHPELIAFATERHRSFVESGRLKPPRSRRKPSQ
jgi:hypothetical protein